MNPFFSIIVPIYNMSGKMDGCYESISNQDYDNFEVLFIDDGSDDDTKNQLAMYCGLDKRFTVICHEENKSLLTARYTGMKHAKGQYILFVDGDDNIAKGTLRLIYDSLVKNPVDILRFGNREVYLDNTSLGNHFDNREKVNLPIETSDLLKAMLLDEISPNVWKNCYAQRVIKEAISRVNPFYCNMSEDIFWTTVFYSCAQSDGILNECLYNYVIGYGMSTNTRNRDIDELKKYVSQINLSFEHIEEYMKKYALSSLEFLEERYSYMMYYILRVFCIDEEDTAKIEEYLTLFTDKKCAKAYAFGQELLKDKCKKFNGENNV